MDRITTAHTAEETEQTAKKAASETAFPKIPNSAMVALMTGSVPPDDHLRGRRTDLAPVLEARMAAAFGMDLSGLKLYRSEAMAGTGMHGLARGNEVVLASDVDLNTLEGQTVLGHELSHIRAQSRGIGMGNSGLLRDASLERQADIEGARAARGMAVVQSGMETAIGISTVFGMEGVEHLTPVGAGPGASAAAPMQASKADNIPAYDLGEEIRSQKARETPAEQPRNGDAEEDNDPLANTEQDKDGEMEGEFGKIPLIWERRIPGNPEQAPKAIVSFSQGKDGLSFAEQNGHALMGLEYSKQSRKYGKKQRYRVDFGFFPKFGSGINQAIEIGQGATVPGQLCDEKESFASVSKKYPISYRQAETVAEKAGVFEKGGYNFFRRNCTTFVAEMTREAGINVGGIFQNEKWLLDDQNKKDLRKAQMAGRFMSTGSDSQYLLDRMNRPDIRVGVDRKLVTQQDIENYRTGRVRGGPEAAGYGPSRSGDRMRVSGLGEGTGKVSSSLEGIRYTMRTNIVRSHLSMLCGKQEELSNMFLTEAGEDSFMQEYNDLQAIIDRIEKMAAMDALDPSSNTAKDLKEYRKNSDRYRSQLQAWLSRNNRPEMLIKGAAEMGLGLLEAADEAVMNRYPKLWDAADADADAPQTDALTELVNDDRLIRENALDRTFGFGPEGRSKKTQFLRLNKGRALGDVRAAEGFGNMKLYFRNIGAYENQITNSLLDMREHILDEDRNAMQGDMDYLFNDLERLHSAGTAQNAPDAKPELKNFAHRAQSAELQTMFGDIRLGEDIGPGELARECNRGVEYAINRKSKYVKLLAGSIAKRSDPAATDPYKLSAEVIKQIRNLYCIPQIFKHSASVRDASEQNIGEQMRKLNRQLGVYADESQSNALDQTVEDERIAGDNSANKENVNKGSRQELLEICREVIDENRRRKRAEEDNADSEE